MGLSVSSLKELDKNMSLERFCGTEELLTFDPIWNNLFSHSIPPVLTKEDDFLLDSCVEEFRRSLLLNNCKTKNFSTLVEVFSSRALELNNSVQTSDNIFIWQAYNALFMIRTILKYFVSATDEEMPAPAPRTPGGSVLEIFAASSEPFEDVALRTLLNRLIWLITELPICNSTYILHLEAVNTIIVALSQQMFTASRPACRISQYRYFMETQSWPCTVAIVRSLLLNYIGQRDPPDACWSTSESSGSLVIGVASGLWNFLKKGVGLSPTPDEVKQGLMEHNLANQSLYLLLVLVNHCTGGHGEKYANPYRAALVEFGNESIANGQGDPEVVPPGTTLPVFTLSYAKLYETICKEIQTDETTLLLYILLHRNTAFKSYILARSDIENLVLPMLKTLYHAPMSTSHHIYMSLIVFLILTEEELFNIQVHSVPLTNTLWYTERAVTGINLGGLIVLVIIRTIQYNIVKMRDKYLHTNCLAALANMSSNFRALHPYVAQRLVGLFETVGKRLVKLMSEAKNLSTTTLENGDEVYVESELNHDLAVLEEVVRMVLEILNSTLSRQLGQNQELVYTLLYKKDVFEFFRQFDSTQELVANLDIVINFFTKRLGTEQYTLTSSEVMRCVEEGVLHWKPDILKKFPDLKFRYVEEDSPEAFFIPYVWSLIYKRTGIHWARVNMDLFNLDLEVL